MEKQTPEEAPKKPKAKKQYKESELILLFNLKCTNKNHTLLMKEWLVK